MADFHALVALYNQGRLAEAEALGRALLNTEPNRIDALKLLGSIKMRQRAPAEARQYFERIVALEPRSAEALSNLAWLLLQLGEAGEALALCDRALALEQRSAGALVARGDALQRLDRLYDALASYDRALALAGAGVDALIGRGSVLARLRQPQEAIATLDRIPVAHEPGQRFNRANLKQSLGLYEAATSDYRALTGTPPFAAAAWQGLLRCAMESCDWPGVAEARGKVLALADAGKPIDPLLVMRISDDPAQHLRCARAAAPKLPPAPRLPAQAASGRRLRLAYVSPDFRIHPLAYLIAELLERHDRERFEVIGVSLGPAEGSDIRARIASAFDQFHDARFRSDEEIVSLMRTLPIDIAVDLAGVTEYARPSLFARRLAPVQAAYLGYCGTSGSSAIDYLVTDRVAVPPEQQQFFSEQLVHLPDSFMVADSAQPIAPQTPSRAQCGLPDDAFVYCCFNKNYKITQPVFDVWLRVLRAVPRSVLWLSANPGNAHQTLRRHAESRGVDPQRIVFAPALPRRADYFARLRAADLFLDTLPYNAHTTACDALFVGLPVLTATGSTFVGRVAASMLHAIGLAELVTRDLDAYEALAIRLAQDAPYRRAIRERLAANRTTAPLFDTDRFRRNLERAYEQMHAAACRGEPPRGFEVSAAG
jgi:predicted O-linked N-acetylglucosamine transferase (SPINDLY family)